MLERKEPELAIYLAKRLLGAVSSYGRSLPLPLASCTPSRAVPLPRKKSCRRPSWRPSKPDITLDEPLWSQYVDYVRHAAVLDLGPSYKYPGKTVNDIIAETFPVSAQLGIISLLLAIGAGVLAGMAAAWYKNTWIDYA